MGVSLSAYESIEEAKEALDILFFKVEDLMEIEPMMAESAGLAVSKDMILRAVKKYENADDVVILSMEDASGNLKEKGFSSSLSILNIDAMVNGNKKSYNWVVKCASGQAHHALLSNKMKTHQRELEVSFYTTLLPKIEDFLASKGEEVILSNFCEIPFSAWTEQDKVQIMQNI